MLEKILVKEVVAPILIVAIFFIVYSIIVKVIRKVTKIKLSYADEKRKKTITNLIINIIRFLFISIAILMILNVYNIDTGDVYMIRSPKLDISMRVMNIQKKENEEKGKKAKKLTHTNLYTQKTRRKFLI